jgi:glycerol-3-phosphate dehydrogenase subunit B
MKQSARHYQCQLAVVGAGLAGMAATIFALQRGIKTAQAGNTGALAYTTGYFDLLGQHNGHLLTDPWQGLDTLRLDEPKHPLARLGNADIRTAFSDFSGMVSAMGVHYTQPGANNHLALTPAGTTKPTLCIPETMLAGPQAMQQQRNTLIIGIHGMQGFSAREIVANLGTRWPQLSAASIEFPGIPQSGQVYPEVLARMLELPKHRQQLADQLQAILGDAEAVGMPAIMGIHKPDKVHGELQRLVGVPLFEIPTMPPGVPGIRLREMCQQVFPDQGVDFIPQQKVQHLELRHGGATLHLKDSFGDVAIDSEFTLLATGRFLSGGLKADRDSLRETLLSLPVIQPECREDWYRHDYFDARGHKINRCGIAVNNDFQPLDINGDPVNERLFAAGALLAGQDWVRQRCGAGVAIASAWQAVRLIADVIDKEHG